jgi:hypothetical protein
LKKNQYDFARFFVNEIIKQVLDQFNGGGFHVTGFVSQCTDINAAPDYVAHA